MILTTSERIKTIRAAYDQPTIGHPEADAIRFLVTEIDRLQQENAELREELRDAPRAAAAEANRQRWDAEDFGR